MGSRSKQALILPDEFADVLREVRASLGWHVLLRDGEKARDVSVETLDDVLGATRIFLADPRTINVLAFDDDSVPARLGWVLLDVPRSSGDELFVVQIGVRDDWLDKATGTVMRNKDAFKRLDKVWKLMAHRLRFPTVAKNIVTGAEAAYSSIGYTPGAAEWALRGGRLRQEGVANIEFIIPSVQRARS